MAHRDQIIFSFWQRQNGVHHHRIQQGANSKEIRMIQVTEFAVEMFCLEPVWRRACQNE
jgi:hypothetical protein